MRPPPPVSSVSSDPLGGHHATPTSCGCRKWDYTERRWKTVRPPASQEAASEIDCWQPYRKSRSWCGLRRIHPASWPHHEDLIATAHSFRTRYLEGTAGKRGCTKSLRSTGYDTAFQCHPNTSLLSSGECEYETKIRTGFTTSGSRHRRAEYNEERLDVSDQEMLPLLGGGGLSLTSPFHKTPEPRHWIRLLGITLPPPQCGSLSNPLQTPSKRTAVPDGTAIARQR